jgi:hypothetical protein
MRVRHAVFIVDCFVSIFLLILSFLPFGKRFLPFGKRTKSLICSLTQSVGDNCTSFKEGLIQHGRTLHSVILLGTFAAQKLPRPPLCNIIKHENCGMNACLSLFFAGSASAISWTGERGWVIWLTGSLVGDTKEVFPRCSNNLLSI